MAGSYDVLMPLDQPDPWPAVKRGVPKLGGVYCLLGPPRSGKTTAMVNLIFQYRDYVDTIYIVSPCVFGDKTIRPIAKIAEAEHEDDPEIIMDALYDPAKLAMYEAALKEAPAGSHHLLVLDDVVNAIPQHAGVWGMLSRWRHLRLTVLIGTQKLRGALPKQARQMITSYIILGCAACERKELDEELVPFEATKALDYAKSKHGPYGIARYNIPDGIAWTYPGHQYRTGRDALYWEERPGDYDRWLKEIEARPKNEKAASGEDEPETTS